MQPDALFQQADTLLAPFRYKFYKNKELALQILQKQGISVYIQNYTGDTQNQ